MKKWVLVCFALGHWAFASAPTPLIVVMGGFGTCPQVDELIPFSTAPKITEIGPKAMAIGRQLEKRFGVTPRYFFSCYTGFLPELPLGRVELRFSGELDPIAYGRVSFRTDQIRGPEFLTGLFKTIEYQTQLIENPIVYLIGHSFGGWSAIHTAHYLRDRGIRMGGLATLDPISPVQCRADRFFYKVVLGPLRSPRGARQAPTDIGSPEELAGLQSALPWWLNIYQTRFRFLHSGPIEQSSNVKFSPPESNPFFNDYHSHLAIDDTAWGWVSDTILGHYPQTCVDRLVSQ